MTSSMDPLFYGGGKIVPVFQPDGVEDFFFAEDIVLCNEFGANVLAPGELADNQDTAACVITFKGRDAAGKGAKAVTIVMEPAGFNALIKALRAKYMQIPLEHR